MVVGRFENGFPVTSLMEDNGEKKIGDGVEVANNFNFDQDQQGSKCPFHSHIRKTNPRSSDFDKSVQMARRGITYGMRLQHPETKEFIDKPNDGVGLLFMSYQASIEDQFHFMQASWANNESFPSAQTGLDPVIGELGVDGHPIEQSWPLLGNQPDQLERKKKLFAGFVSLKGGEYFFAPSIAGIRSLGVI
jgi:deferrochelatase/peroxidase EfeB